MDPVNKKLEDIEKSLSGKVNALEKRMTILEGGVKTRGQKTDVLSEIVVNMQRALSSMDAEVRALNVIVSGLPELQITDHDNENTIYTSDYEKYKYIFKEMMNDVSDIDQDACDGMKFERIGKERTDNKPRFLKVTMPDKETKIKVLDNSKKLKRLQDPWKKVYIKRGNHIVFQKEFNRVGKKMSNLRALPEYADNLTGRIKIIKGDLKVDGVPIDKNHFL